ncbi:MAG: ABC-F family ATP-binding cassette domain-containing protein [Alphaproteobacteria bacterium]|nr:ABC-F family ATP-binding cassette domain-containing protein [Alphaproteobacteria bacterium]
MLRLESATVSAGTRELLIEVDLVLREGERLGLVGPNGSGKTTLLRALAGEHGLDSGRRGLQSGVALGYLPQDAVSGSSETLWDEVRSGLGALLALQEELHRAEAALDGSETAVARHGKLLERFRLAGGYAMDERVGEVLWGLGFSKEDWRRPCTAFSGGWQMRIALARLLVERPQVLLLDEPTNHLDLHARAWLARALAEHPGTVLIVSHDAYVLNQCVNGIVEVRAGGLDRYTGDFDSFERQRAERDALVEATLERQQDEAAKLRRFVERFGAKATKASQAQSRKKRLEKLQGSMVEVVADRAPPRLRFATTDGASAQLVGLRGAALGYDTPLLEGVDLDLQRGERWVVLGPNGAGKSTLMKALSGALRPLAGSRVLGRGVRIGWFEQDQAAALPAEETPLQHLLAQAPFCPETRARAALGAMGLSGEDALRPIGTLSGGEKARVALATLSVQGKDVLLLDEPTNHLDVVTVGVLTRALGDFPGAVMVISHDRRLVEQVATHVIHVDALGFRWREGLHPEDLEPPSRAEALGGSGETSTQAAESHKDRQRRLREAERTAKALAEAEARVAELEDALEEVDVGMVDAVGDPERLVVLVAEHARISEALDAAMHAWEALAEQAEAG